MAFEDESLYAVIAIPLIFILGLAGVGIPSIVAVLFPKYGLTRKLYFSFFNGLAGGLILAVGLVHSLPDAIEALESVMEDTNVDEKIKDYPWPLLIMLIAILILHAVEELLDVATHRFSKDPLHLHHQHGGAHEDHAYKHTVADHVVMDGECERQPLLAEEDDGEGVGQKRKRASRDYGIPNSHNESNYKHSQAGKATTPSAIEMFVKMAVLFVGLFFHNIFVGLALGIADNDYALFIALLFHQFFEGLGMGARVAMANMRHAIWVVIIDLVFAATPSIFIGIGIGIKNGVAEADNEKYYKIVNCVFQSLSAGMLVNVALVHMMRGYKDVGISGTQLDFHRLASFLGLLLGAAIMSVIGIWA